MEVDVLEQRARGRLLRRLEGAILPGCPARPHHGPALLGHHRPDVREVDVHETGADDELGDPLNGSEQHVVRRGEGGLQGHPSSEHADQAFVGYHDERIDLLRQLVDSGPGDGHAPAELERKRPGDHRDRQHVELGGDLRDDRRCPRARAPAHAGGDEEHVGALEDLRDAVAVLERRGSPELGVRTRAEPLGEVGPELHVDRGRRLRQRLGIGVRADEVDPLDGVGNHVLDRVSAPSADADDLDAGLVGATGFHDFKHGSSLPSGFR